MCEQRLHSTDNLLRGFHLNRNLKLKLFLIISCYVLLQVGLPVRDLKKRAATQGLRDMNIAQLQVLVNDLHTQIESKSWVF